MKNRTVKVRGKGRKGRKEAATAKGRRKSCMCRPSVVSRGAAAGKKRKTERKNADGSR